MTTTNVPGRVRFDFGNGKILEVDIAKVDGYDFGDVNLYDGDGNLIASPARIKPTNNGKLELQTINSSSASEDLVLDDNGLWTSAA